MNVVFSAIRLVYVRAGESLYSAGKALEDLVRLVASRIYK